MKIYLTSSAIRSTTRVEDIIYSTNSFLQLNATFLQYIHASGLSPRVDIQCSTEYPLEGFSSKSGYSFIAREAVNLIHIEMRGG